MHIFQLFYSIVFKMCPLTQTYYISNQTIPRFCGWNLPHHPLTKMHLEPMIIDKTTLLQQKKKFSDQIINNLLYLRPSLLHFLCRAFQNDPLVPVRELDVHLSTGDIQNFNTLSNLSNILSCTGFQPYPGELLCDAANVLSFLSYDESMEPSRCDHFHCHYTRSLENHTHTHTPNIQVHGTTKPPRLFHVFSWLLPWRTPGSGQVPVCPVLLWGWWSQSWSLAGVSPQTHRCSPWSLVDCFPLDQWCIYAETSSLPLRWLSFYASRRQTRVISKSIVCACCAF